MELHGNDFARFVDELKDFGLTPDEIERILNALKIIHVAQAIGYYGGIPGHEFDRKYSEQTDMLVRLGMVSASKIIEGLHSYSCTEEGDKIASELIANHLEKIKSNLLEFLSRFPRKLIAFWLQFGTEIIDYGKFKGEALMSKDYAYAEMEEIFSNEEIVSEISELWNGLVSMGMAVITCDNVSTRGGELRERRYIISRKVARFMMMTMPQPELRVEIANYAIFGVLKRYMTTTMMPRKEFLRLISDRQISEQKIENLINELFQLGLTTRYTKSERAPFLIRDLEGFQRFLKEKFIEPLVEVILEKKPESALPEKSAKIFLEKQEETPYDSLTKLENELRKFIARELGLGSSEMWKERVPPDIRENCEDRKMRRESPWPWFPKKDEPLISFADFTDYVKIIVQRRNWGEVFEKVFKDKEMISAKLRELEPIRVDIAHSRELSPEEIEILRLNSKHILTCISQAYFHDKNVG